MLWVLICGTSPLNIHVNNPFEMDLGVQTIFVQVVVVVHILLHIGNRPRKD